MTPLGQYQLAADLQVRGVAWGTRLDVTCRYLSHPPKDLGPLDYVLVVRTRAGGEEQVGTWRGVPGKQITFAAATRSRTAGHRRGGGPHDVGAPAAPGAAVTPTRAVTMTQPRRASTRKHGAGDMGPPTTTIPGVTTCPHLSTCPTTTTGSRAGSATVSAAARCCAPQPPGRSARRPSCPATRRRPHRGAVAAVVAGSGCCSPAPAPPAAATCPRRPTRSTGADCPTGTPPRSRWSPPATWSPWTPSPTRACWRTRARTRASSSSRTASRSATCSPTRSPWPPRRRTTAPGRT